MKLSVYIPMATYGSRARDWSKQAQRIKDQRRKVADEFAATAESVKLMTRLDIVRVEIWRCAKTRIRGGIALHRALQTVDATVRTALDNRGRRVDRLQSVFCQTGRVEPRRNGVKIVLVLE